MIFEILLVFHNTPLELIVVAILCVTFFVLWLSFFLIILLSKPVQRRSREIRQRTEKGIEDVLNQWLFDAEHQTVELTDPRIKELMDKSYKRQIFIDKLIEFKGLISGGMKERIAHLYLALNLSVHSMKKLKSKKPHLIARGLQELSVLKHPKVAQLSLKFINSRSRLLRNEAQLAIIRRHGFEVLHILNQVVLPMSDWQQIRIINSLQQFSSNKKPLVQLFESKNPDILILATRILTEFQIFDFEEQLIKLIKHPVTQVRKAAYAVFNEMNMHSHVELLEARLVDERSPEVKKEIIKALGPVGNERSLTVLHNVVRKEDFESAYYAARSIHEIDVYGKVKSKALNRLLERIKDEDR